MMKADPVLQAFQAEIKQRLVNLDMNPPQFSVDANFIIQTVWGYLKTHEKELFCVGGVSWQFAYSTEQGQLSPILVIRYQETNAILAYACYFNELVRFCNLLKVVSGVDRVQVMGIDNCVRCHYSPENRNWIYDFE